MTEKEKVPKGDPFKVVDPLPDPDPEPVAPPGAGEVTPGEKTDPAKTPVTISVDPIAVEMIASAPFTVVGAITGAEEFYLTNPEKEKLEPYVLFTIKGFVTDLDKIKWLALISWASAMTGMLSSKARTVRDRLNDEKEKKKLESKDNPS